MYSAKPNTPFRQEWRTVTESENPTPCPFCRCIRDDDELHSIWLELHTHTYLIDGLGPDAACWVRCPVCEASGPIRGNAEDAVKAWNRGWQVLGAYIDIVTNKPVDSEVVGITFQVKEDEDAGSDMGI